jgi:trimeric autotransporter adhesin
VTGSYNLAAGAVAGVTINGSYNVALGYNAGGAVTGSQNLAFGRNAGRSINASYTTSIGTGSRASGGTAIALGYNAAASASSAVAIGTSSTATVANTVSVGSASIKRRIVNVANGVANNDAATVGQVKALVAAATGTSSAPVAQGQSTDEVAKLRALVIQLQERIAKLEGAAAARVSSLAD